MILRVLPPILSTKAVTHNINFYISQLAYSVSNMMGWVDIENESVKPGRLIQVHSPPNPHLIDTLCPTAR